MNGGSLTLATLKVGDRVYVWTHSGRRGAFDDAAQMELTVVKLGSKFVKVRWTAGTGGEKWIDPAFLDGRVDW